VSAQKPNTQKSVAVNEEASAELPKLRREQEQFLRGMENLMRRIDADTYRLRHRVQNVLALLRGFSDYVRANDIPEGCPGWGRYTMPPSRRRSTSPPSPCALCRWNAECLTAGAEFVAFMEEQERLCEESADQ
jgi:hypothetical protein